MELWLGDVSQEVSTGDLPEWNEVDALVEAAYRRYRSVGDGAVADYIPALAAADPEQFGACVVGTDGGVHSSGDTQIEFSIQSISKAFVYALACQELGHELVRERVGVNNSGAAFNSIIAIELNDGHPMNPWSMRGRLRRRPSYRVPLQTSDGSRPDGLSEFAGRPLELDAAVYRSESESNQRNRAIAQLLASYGRVELDPDEVVDVYTKQCSLKVDARDLAVMGATLADGASTRSPVGESYHPEYVATRWPFCLRRDCTNAPVSGCSRSDCLPNRVFRVASCRLRRVSAESGCSHRSWTLRETAFEDSSRRLICRGFSD